jgi:hypothetical protein
MSSSRVLKSERAQQISADYPKVKIPGYIYIMYSEDFPECLKVGKTTDPAQRYNQYNNYNPRCSFNYIAVSHVYDDYDLAEKVLLQTLDDAGLRPVYQKEWFDSQKKDDILCIFDTVEALFSE